MSETFKFQCPECKRTYKANKDLGGRLKRCGQCRGTFTIKRARTVKAGAPPPKPEPEILHDPELPIDQVFAALHDVPGPFSREAAFGRFDPAYRITLSVSIEANGRSSREQAQRETAELPPQLGDGARQAAKKVVDLRFDHTSELAKLLADKPGTVRSAAEHLAKELRPPAGGRFTGRHLVVEHLQVWKAHWVYRQEEGDAWFFGRPLRAYVPNPPKASRAGAVLGTFAALAALGAVGYVLWEYDLIKPGAFREPAPPPPPVAPKPAANQPVRFAADGLLQVEDGSFLRGKLERKGEAVLVDSAGVSYSLDPWQIESLHVDAPIFIRGEARRLDDLEGRVKGSKGSSREAIVGLFLEIHRQRDRWGPLAKLCAPAELPGDPQKRLDVLLSQVEKLLEAPAVAATPDVAPKPVEPSPAVAVAAGLLAQLVSTTDRPALAASLQALKAEKLPQTDLLDFAMQYLARSDAEAGLAVDRLHVKTPQFDHTFEGAFEKQNDSFAKLRLPAGPLVTVYKEGKGWVALLPGDVKLSDALVTLTPGARTASSERLKAAFDRLPPAKWMSAPAAEHLKAAKALDLKPSKDRGQGVLRALAAGHAGTALRSGAPAEILEARVLLHGLGYQQAGDGRWERPEDRRAAQMGRLLADGKPEDAKAQLPGSRLQQDFFGLYRAAALHLQSPVRNVGELNRAVAALDQALGQAATPGESKHLLALKSAVAGYGICASCGGTPAKVCSTCRGKGTRTEACARCNGQGYIVTVGIGATGNKTCDACGGKPIKGTRPCEKCDGKGSRSCAKCQGQTRLPAAADLSRTRPCASCGGAGSRGDSIAHPCASCAALGVQLVPAGAPDATLP